MTDREKVVNGLECCAVGCRSGCPYSDIDDCESMLCADALALLKVQNLTVEPKLLELEDETKAWLDEMDAVDALGNIACICMDFDGYRTANGLGELINEVRTYAKYCADRLKAREQQHDYETSVEVAQYCERYEPTYNSEDGSM